MSDETEQNNQIALFMEISGKAVLFARCCAISINVWKSILLNIWIFFFSSFVTFQGADFDTAKQALTLNNFNLEQAINYHLERSNSFSSPEDDVAGT